MVVLVFAVPVVMVAMAVVVRVFFLQEVRVDVQLGIEIEATQVQHLGQRHIAKMHRADGRARVHVLEAVDQVVLFLLAHQVGLGQEYLVGKAHLPACLLAVVQLLLGVLGVHQSNDGIDEIGLGDLIVHEKSLRHGAGVGKPRGLDHHAVERHQPLAALGGQQLQGFAQILADGAADAAVAHLQNLLFGLGLEDVGVDVFLAELVFDHGDLLAVHFGQHALEQRGLAGAEEAGEDGDGNQGHGSLSVECKRKTAAWTTAAWESNFSVQSLSRPSRPQRHAGLRMMARPLRYSPSGNSSVIGWSGAPARRPST